MKKILLLFIVLFRVWNGGFCVFAQDILPLIPKAVEVNILNGSFLLSSKTRIIISPANEEIVQVAQTFAAELEPLIGSKVEVSFDSIKEPKQAIILRLNDRPNATLGTEGYTLLVSPTRITISANKTVGLFYGIQSLRQLIPVEKQNGQTAVQCVTITDYPHYAWRGLMLDVSRHFFSKEFVKRYIDQMAKYKLNVFHWHLTDNQGWRIEIKGMPELTNIGAWRVPRTGKYWTFEFPESGEKATDGGFYTQEDIREVVEYAGKRFVNIVPEIDIPGHSLAFIASFPEACCTQKQYHVNAGFSHEKDDIVLCLGNEDNFKKLEIIFSQIAALFPGKYIHIGGDEAGKEFWKKCPRCQKRMAEEGLKNEEELQSYFIKRIEKILNSNGKKLVGWDEILEGGLAPEATVMSWRGVKGGITAAKEGHNVIMSPGDNLYLNQLQGDLNIERVYAGGVILRTADIYGYDPLPEGMDAKHLLGAQANLWSEFVASPRLAEYMTWPRALALSEILWSPKSHLNWDNFVPRMEAQFPRFEQAHVNYAASIYDPIISTVIDQDGQTKIVFKTEIKGLKIYYTFNYTVPDNFAEEYHNDPLTVPKGATDIWAVTYRNGKPAGRLLTINLEELKRRK